MATKNEIVGDINHGIIMIFSPNIGYSWNYHDISWYVMIYHDTSKTIHCPIVAVPWSHPCLSAQSGHTTEAAKLLRQRFQADFRVFMVDSCKNVRQEDGTWPSNFSVPCFAISTGKYAIWFQPSVSTTKQDMTGSWSASRASRTGWSGARVPVLVHCWGVNSLLGIHEI